jgi:hypothetical protein
MPTKRRRRTRPVTVQTMDSFSLHDLLCFSAGWRPPQSDTARARGRWSNYEAYLEDYVSIRPEFLESPAGHGPCFAECLYRAVQAGRSIAEGIADYETQQRQASAKECR